VRCWRLRHNPLEPRSYVVEAWLLLATWTLAVVAAVAVGVPTARAVERGLDDLRAQRHVVSAVLTEDAERTTAAADGTDGGRAWATVRWTRTDGTTRTGMTRVDAASRAGDVPSVWLDAKGRLVPEPPNPGQVELQGAVLDAVAAVSACTAVAPVGWGARARLDRQRLEQWGKEWSLIGPQWGRKMS
jgi:hypothetical protein